MLHLIPYHLHDQASRVILDMINHNIIKEHPINQPTPWVSNIVITPKANGSLKMTLDAHNINKAIIPNNHPIRQQDIKSKLAGCTLFSKMDFKSAFWQIEPEDFSRYVTVFFNAMTNYTDINVSQWA